MTSCPDQRRSSVPLCLQGSVDQVDGLLCFETDTEGLQQWDEQIGLVCNRLNTILETAAAKGLGLPIEV